MYDFLDILISGGKDRFFILINNMKFELAF